jgi:adenylate cyclase
LSVRLTITEPTGRTFEAEIDSTKTYTIGRAKENDVVLNDRRASRKHAFVVPDNGVLKLVDGYYENGTLFRSVNHVFINGTMKLEHELADGDSILIGESRLEVSIIPELVPEPEPDEKVHTVSFDDAPLGHTQVHLSVNDLLASPSDISIEAALTTPAEIKDLRRKAKALQLLFEMSKTIGSAFELEEIFAKATELIFRGTPADRVVALLTTEDADGNTAEDELVPIGSKTRDASFEKKVERLGVSRTITSKVMKDRVAILSQDARTDEQFQGAVSIVSQGVRSTICAPLVTPSNVHGVIYADRLDQFSTFSDDHLEMISAVAALTAVTVETVKAHKRLAREEVARANYSRFMPEYVVQQLLENPDSFRLGGANQTITVLFADIRGFTAVSEKENPENIVRLLNHYFTAMSEIIFKHGGTLDKYIGDGLMALFGAPTATPADARNAVHAAVAMQRELVRLKTELAAEGFGSIAMGVGLHTGVATVGYIGSERRSEYTAIGDTVNLASRLESNAAGGQILISEATARAAMSGFPLVRREPIIVKNRQQPVELYEVDWSGAETERNLP